MKADKKYIIVTLTFMDLVTEGQEINEIKNYLRRVRSYRETHSIGGKLQYVYPRPPRERIVMTVIMSGMDLDKFNPGKLWKKGLVKAEYCNPDETTPKELALFLKSKYPNCRWTSSKNLKSRYLKHVMKYLKKGGAG